LKKTIVVVMALAVFAAAMVLKEKQRSSESMENETEHQLMQAQQTNAPLPRLIDLGSDKCVPCKQMAPILENLSEEYQGSLIVDFINVRANPDAGKQWNIRVIPTQIFVDATGKELFRHEGFMDKAAILDQWKELGITFPHQPATAE